MTINKSANSTVTSTPLLAEATLGSMIGIAFLIVFSLQTVAVFA